MSILLYDPSKKSQILDIHSGPHANSRWIAELGVCKNPCCTCCHVDFKCTPEEASAQASLAPVCFAVDLAERSAYSDGEQTRAPGSEILAKAVADALDSEDWKNLHHFFQNAKREQMDHSYIHLMDAEFPREVLDGDATTVGCNSIFPFAPLLTFAVGSKHWVAVDDYCVNPKCNCRDVILQFLATDGEVLIEKQLDPPAMYYHYGKRTFKPAEPSSDGQPSLETLLSELKNQRESFDAEIKKRHQLLRSLFKKALAKRRAQDLAAVPARGTPQRAMGVAKPGRNDLCPCGSGKKYKKCCGK